MFVSPAYAQAGASGGFDIGVFLPLILIFVVFYFLLIRPQQKKMKQHRGMVAGLRRGDRVVTAGGLVGTVAKVVDENEILVDIAEGVRVRVVRGTISEVVTKPQPAPRIEEPKKKPPRPDRLITKADYYQILGIQKNASTQQISNSYRKLVKKYHPDQNRGDPDADQKFRQIAEAYETLRNEKLRRLYDDLGHSEYQKRSK